ncbi:MAG: hypothetical protein A2151_04745 [Candidatus Muproteobacteria bacterium RBG_16_65_34]|uniref:Uncharacterized protein n=1 Tax=Candidatus Muproteobacteria bacterium RBG_16_65_34 TaxID=1817760 RepID=A0A1F6TK40_9PROT|nr:MAG: hypothetical protein A2151_04745 [Candidatus Muproteobacteria bacterium RBG_16_65_34]
MKAEFREKILKQLRRPSRKADMLIERHLGNPGGAAGCRPYTSDVESALALLPEGVHFLCGRFEEGKLFWCDVGFRPQVQAWGETMAAAVAGAIFAYATHPEVDTASLRQRSGGNAGSA